MAACGTAVSDVKEDAVCDDDHSLTNVVAFSTTKKQMCAPSKEGLITREENGTLIDRRIKICYDGVMSNSYMQLCQVTAKCPRGKGVGSACFAGQQKSTVIITCAHNFISWSSRRKCGVPFENLRFYGMRDGEKKWLFLGEGNEKTVLIHPKYNGHPDCGYDIGIATSRQSPADVKDRLANLFPKVKDVKKDSDITTQMSPKNVVKGMTIEVMGYPGEKKGYPYTHTGQILDIVESDIGGWVLWYDVDTTPGNSGSPIFLTDEKYLKQNSWADKLLIGVHTGHDEAEGCNFGTFLTPSLYDWISGYLK